MSVRSPNLALVTDPGNGGAVPVSASSHMLVDLVTAGAETRTMAAPQFIGQCCSFSFSTDGGDCVLTIASTVNQTGNNTCTFADVGDHLKLEAVNGGSGLEWRVVANDGVGLSTV